MGLKKLQYNYLEKVIFDLSQLDIDDNNYQPLQLFHITHSPNINWITREYKYRQSIKKIMINMTYYPKSLYILNQNLLEQNGIHMNDYKLLKTQILDLISFEYKINETDLQSIVIAPILSSRSYPIIGLFILNNQKLLQKITTNLDNSKMYTLISNFENNNDNNNETNQYSIIKDIKFADQVGNNLVKIHDNTIIYMDFIKLPISLLIKNISTYFPKLNPILVQNNIYAFKSKFKTKD
jgi:hypothetical protein